MRKAVFLDRDGVLNAAIRDARGRPRPPRSEAEFRILPGVPEACARLRHAGFALIAVTNQPDIARGQTPRGWVEALNARIVRDCGLDGLRMCEHDDDAGCECRKPRPGLLLAAASDDGLVLEESWIVGDRWRDIACGQAAGCRTILIDHGWAESGPMAPPVATVGSLPEAAMVILGKRQGAPSA
jgi:D-glycero-D-manno-heptose 1,7-bisphosphate phosphatase